MATWKPFTTTPAPGPHKYRYAHAEAAQRLVWTEDELPAHLHAGRLHEAHALLDDAVALFGAHGREARKVAVEDASGHSWEFRRTERVWISVTCTPAGTLSFASVHEHGRFDLRSTYRPSFNAAERVFVGKPIPTGTMSVVRDLTAKGIPVVYTSALEELVIELLTCAV
ncbi:MAG: hypothetical protein Q8P41_29215 [Pseudomonadota bacterium]|nr:hypothetical protein [Pseudomonadota bacterium]